MQLNILIAPGTTGVAREISSSLMHVKNIKLFGAGFDLKLAESFPYSDFRYLREFSKNSFQEIELITSELKIDYIFLAHDSWIYEFREKQNIGSAKVINHNSRAVSTARFKLDTYHLLKQLINTPTAYVSPDQIKSFPVFVKPNAGQGSRGAKVIKTSKELIQYTDKNTNQFTLNWICTEFLPGEEFTVDCYSNFKNVVIYKGVRSRRDIIDGITTTSKFVHAPEVEGWAELISNKLKLTGAWFFQYKFDSMMRPKLLEIGLRIAGASALSRVNGVNLTLIWIYESRGFDVQIPLQENFAEITRKENRNLALIYGIDTVVSDFDDTLIVNGHLNLGMVTMISKLRSYGKRIILMTRHNGEIHNLLEEISLRELFDEIIRVENGEKKSDFFRRKWGRTIFVDDSFYERTEVLTALKKNIFAVDPSFISNLSIEYLDEK